MLLKSELLGVEPPSPRTDRVDERTGALAAGALVRAPFARVSSFLPAPHAPAPVLSVGLLSPAAVAGGASASSSPSRNIFRFKAPRQARPDDTSYSLSPVGSVSQRFVLRSCFTRLCPALHTSPA